jgi:hypothetical protein
VELVRGKRHNDFRLHQKLDICPFHPLILSCEWMIIALNILQQISIASRCDLIKLFNVWEFPSATERTFIKLIATMCLPKRMVIIMGPMNVIKMLIDM